MVLAKIALQSQLSTPKSVPSVIIRAVLILCLYGCEDYHFDKKGVLNVVNENAYSEINDAIENILHTVPRIETLLREAFKRFTKSEKIPRSTCSEEDTPFLFIFAILSLRWDGEDSMSSVLIPMLASVDLEKYAFDLKRVTLKILERSVRLIILMCLVC